MATATKLSSELQEKWLSSLQPRPIGFELRLSSSRLDSPYIKNPPGNCLRFRVQGLDQIRRPLAGVSEKKRTRVVTKVVGGYKEPRRGHGRGP